MKTENVFIGLSKHMPKENYFTECFAFFLRNNKQLLKRLINDMLREKRQKSKIILDLKPADFDVKTQESYGRKGIVDIVISCGNKATIFVENKLGARLGETQKRKYRELLKSEKKKYDEVFVFLITEQEQEVDESESFLCFRWLEVNSLLKNYIEEQDYPFLREFLEFMKGREDMNSFSGFKLQEYGLGWEEYAECKENADKILGEIIRIMGKKGFTWYKDDGPRFIGIQFYNRKKYGWSVYYWIGLNLVDKSVHFQIELSIRKRLREYLRDKYYSETRDMAENLEDKFEFEWDRDPSIVTSIKLIDLIKGVKSRGAQKKKIINFFKKTTYLIDRSGMSKLIQKAVKEFKT